MSEHLDHKNTPWMTVGLDWEGVAAALGALLVALLLGALWSPLFWIGFVGVVLALMAARWSHRTPPDLRIAPHRLQYHTHSYCVRPVRHQQGLHADFGQC